MQEKFLNYICCPECGGAIRMIPLEWRREYYEDIVEGLLLCQECGMAYPVVNGIPRMLKTSLMENPEFMARHRATLENIKTSENIRFVLSKYKKTFQPTAESFGYEWQKYKVTPKEEDIVTFFGLTGIDPRFYENHEYPDTFTYYPTAKDIAAIDASFLKSRLVLDVGCGMGKYTDLVSDYGAEVVGLDLSLALERAREKTRHKPNVHLIQGNIFFPPLRKEIFDFGFSLGVLHHTPNTETAFKKMASLIKPGGTMSAWVYPSALSRYEALGRLVQDDLLRPILRRLPHRALYQVCRLLGAMVLLRAKLMTTNLRGRYKIERLLGLFAVRMHKDIEIASFLNFDWYSPQYRFYQSEEEVYQWYEEADFRDIRILRQRVSGIAVKKNRIELGHARLLDFEPSRKNALISGESLSLTLQWQIGGSNPYAEEKTVVYIRNEKAEYLSANELSLVNETQTASIHIPEDAPTGIYEIGMRLCAGTQATSPRPAKKHNEHARLGEIEVVNKKQNEDALRKAMSAPLSDERLQPVQANFESRVLLKGIARSSSTVPKETVWNVTLEWHTLVRPDDRLSTGIFFHDSNGKLAFSTLQYTKSDGRLYFHAPGTSFVESIRVLIPKNAKLGQYQASLGLRYRNYKSPNDQIGIPALSYLDDTGNLREFYRICDITVVES